MLINLHCRSSGKSIVYFVDHPCSAITDGSALCSWCHFPSYFVLCYHHRLEKEITVQELLVVHAGLLKHQKVFHSCEFYSRYYSGEKVWSTFPSRLDDSVLDGSVTTITTSSFLPTRSILENPLQDSSWDWLAIPCRDAEAGNVI